MEKSDNVHAFHRGRLKQRFMKEGLDSFEDHNILELLLFYAIPRKDTNELAHRLIDRFGSLSAVLDADIKALRQCDGIGENTAVLLKLIPQLARSYRLEKMNRVRTAATMKELDNYFTEYFFGKNEESLVAVYLNSDLDILGKEIISTGTVSATAVVKRRILEEGFRFRAASVILAHNHPGGRSVPSKEDVAVTAELSRLLSEFSLPVIEHYVVGADGVSRIISGGEARVKFS